VKKLISIGVALALLTMVVAPVAVAADDPPPTYAKIPFTIIGEGIVLVGDLVSMADSKLGLGLGFDVAQFTGPIADFTQGPLGYTVDMLAWGLYAVAGLAGPVITEFAPDMGWIGDLLDELWCYFFTPFPDLEGVCPPVGP
jgi:hypothetical protein